MGQRISLLLSNNNNNNNRNNNEFIRLESVEIDEYNDELPLLLNHNNNYNNNRIIEENLFLPEDVITHIMTFLNSKELGRMAVTCQLLRNIAYIPHLWKRMDLSKSYGKVNTAFLHNMLNTHRFCEIEFLSLEFCSAITTLDPVIKHCHHLKILLLTGCIEIDDESIIDAVQRLPLKRLELYRTNNAMHLVDRIRHIRPMLNLGFAWYEYCALTGIPLDNNNNNDNDNSVQCQYEERLDLNRSCWGRIRGRVLYSNRDYNKSGNYPIDVIYSCQNHREEDYNDERFDKCLSCQRLFRHNSMWTEFTCRTCHDYGALHDKRAWIQLNNKDINELKWSDIADKCSILCDRKNMPIDMRFYGRTSIVVDQSLHDENDNDILNDSDNDIKIDNETNVLYDDEKKGHSTHSNNGNTTNRLDPESIPLPIFLRNNTLLMDNQVQSVQTILKRAKNHDETRAMLMLENENSDIIEIWADRRPILDGIKGAQNMLITVQAWHKALQIMYPMAVIMLLVMLFRKIVHDFRVAQERLYNEGDHQTTYLPEDDNQSASTMELTALVITITLFIVLIVLCLMLRFRDSCEQLFRKFLVADIFIIFVFGFLNMFTLFVEWLKLPVDSISCFIIAWNFGIAGLYSLYFNVSPSTHRFFLATLHIIMAIMMVVALGPIVVFIFLAFAVLGDLFSEYRPNLLFTQPFISERSEELELQTPRITYNVGGIRLRTSDLMWYGMLMGIGSPTLLDMTLSFVLAFGSLVLLLFVAPFLNKIKRPLPISFALVLLGIMFRSNAVAPYLLSLQHHMIYSSK